MEEEKGRTFSELKGILEAQKISRADLEKLKKKNFDEISDTAKEILQNIGINADNVEEALRECESILEERVSKEQKNLEKLEHKDSKKQDESEEKEESSSTRREIQNFLQERSLSQSFITIFLKIGFTEEVQRFLYAMGFTCEDNAILRRLWDIEMKEREEIDSFASLPSSSNEYLSSDGLYLKYSFSKPLTSAIREIIAKKPFDPVEYLGHWLLNYKVCEERDKLRKENELELMIERERFKQSIVKVESPVSIQEEEEEEEEFVNTWDFLEDE